MEGVGSRLGRVSSRYGSSSSVFSGPVRKWKRRWVHVSYQTNNSSRPNNGNNHNTTSGLVLCRWTPISPSHPGDSPVKTEEPPRRKFRYVPIVALEEQKQETVGKVEDKAKTAEANPFITGTTSKRDGVFEIPDTEGVFTDQKQAATKNRLAHQDSNMSRLDLDSASPDEKSMNQIVKTVR